MTILNNTVKQTIETKFNLWVNLVDSRGYYIVTPNTESSKAMHFMISYTNMVNFLSELCNIDTELITHDSRVYTVFHNKK